MAKINIPSHHEELMQGNSKRCGRATFFMPLASAMWIVGISLMLCGGTTLLYPKSAIRAIWV